MLSPLPANILEVLQTPSTGRRTAKKPKFVTGQRNQAAASLAGTYQYYGLSPHEIEARMMAINDNSDDPLSHDELLGVIDSISRYETDPLGDLSEIAVAGHFSKIHYGNICVSNGIGWSTYSGSRWIPDTDGLTVQELVKTHCRVIAAEVSIAAAELEPEQAKALKKQARTLQTRTKVSNIVKLAMSDPLLRANSSKFDENVHLFNCQNGTLNLETLQFQDHSASDMLTRMSNVSYDPNAECPTFKRFLSDILPEEHQKFFLRLMGASILGNPVDQIFVIIHGAGKNGKTTLVNSCLSLLGDYGVTVEPSTLLAYNKQNTRNDIARLAGRRLVVTTETPQGGILDSAMVKRLSGNDTITARYLYKELFEFEPQFVAYMVTNHPPVINGADKALARRLISIKFDRRISDTDADPYLNEKLKKEWPGIFNLILDGLKDYRQNGLDIPKSIQQDTDAYVRQSNVMETFIDECLTKDVGAKLRATELQATYRWWMQSNGYKPLSSSQFKTEFQRTTELEQQRDKKGNYWAGYKLVQ